jgi:ADP-ribose pyrophosphatase YjhB (NUDIX family)
MISDLNSQVKFGLGVFTLILNKDFSKIFLLKRNAEKRKKFDADWGNVGGRVELREHSIDAAVREAREEAGLNLDKNNIKLIDILEHPNFTPRHHSIHFVYAASIYESTPIIINDESDEYGWFDLKNLPDRMIDKKEDIIQWAQKARSLL